MFLLLGDLESALLVEGEDEGAVIFGRWGVVHSKVIREERREFSIIVWASACYLLE
jgi:hypothetical protein